MTPEIIPGYKIREQIGAGGYGEVWKADAPGGLVKAVKFVYGRLDGERATRELKALSRIKEVRHPFLLSLERIEVIDGQLIIVTELADASLMNRYEQCTAAGAAGIPRQELLVYMSDAADALDYMRQTFSLQHLDIKPENLLILSGRVKVADFGLVKDIHDVTVSLVGGLTPIYAAPEVFAGHPSLHSDQYSLAVVYQELLTGVLPFPGATMRSLPRSTSIARRRLAPLPPDDRPIIARALAKHPKTAFRRAAPWSTICATARASMTRQARPRCPHHLPRVSAETLARRKPSRRWPTRRKSPSRRTRGRRPPGRRCRSTEWPNRAFPPSAISPRPFCGRNSRRVRRPRMIGLLSLPSPQGAVQDLPPQDAAARAWRLRPSLFSAWAARPGGCSRGFAGDGPTALAIRRPRPSCKCSSWIAIDVR